MPIDDRTDGSVLRVLEPYAVYLAKRFHEVKSHVRFLDGKGRAISPT